MNEYSYFGPKGACEPEDTPDHRHAMKELVEEWRLRKGCLRLTDDYDRGKAQIYGQCAKELQNLLEEKLND